MNCRAKVEIIGEMLDHEKHTDDSANGRSGGGQAHGSAAFALTGQRVTVQSGGRRGRGARNIDQDRSIGSAIGAADIDREQADHGHVSVHAVGKCGEQGHPKG